MAYKPTTQKLKDGVKSADIINAVLNSNPVLRDSDIPRIDTNGSVGEQTTTMHEIGNILDKNQDYYNAFVPTLFNRIIMTIIQTIYFTNPLRRVKRGFLEAGDIVEEIAFRLCMPHQYDSTDDSAYPKQEPPSAETAIHKINYQKYYKTTVNKKSLIRAFLSYNGMEEFVNEQISTMYTSAELDEYLATKYMLGRAALNGYIQTVSITGGQTESALKQLSVKMRGMSNNMDLLKTKYNYSHIPTRARKQNQLILLNTDIEAAMDVEVLADAFNMSRADFIANRILIDSYGYDDVVRMNQLFGEEVGYVPFTAQELEILNSIDAWHIDERFFMIFDAEFEMTSFFNPEKLYYNFWLHTWKVMSFSTFVDAVIYSSKQGVLNGITITAPQPAIAIGKSELLTAEFTYTGDLPQLLPSVVWTIKETNTTSTLVPLSENTAYLTIGTGEPNTSLTIDVTATLDDGTVVSGQTTVTIG